MQGRGVPFEGGAEVTPPREKIVRVWLGRRSSFELSVALFSQGKGQTGGDVTRRDS